MYRHECIVIYVIVMHASVYVLLRMQCGSYGYACMVGEACIVRPLYEIRLS